MKKLVLLFVLGISCLSSMAFASDVDASQTISIPQILMFEDHNETMVRRCVNDNGCRPGVEMCAGGYCVPTRGGPPFCRVDRDCAPHRCVGGRCR